MSKMYKSSDENRSNVFSGHIKKYKISENVTLSSGYQLNDCEIAYETYGNLNKEKNNAILVCHAISGDSNSKNGRAIEVIMVIFASATIISFAIALLSKSL